MTQEFAQKKRMAVIVGPTASGKSDLADFLALKFGGAVINADARQVYQGLTAVTAAHKADEKHLLYEFLNLSAPFSFAEYVLKADTEIKNVSDLPIVVGGSGLYVDALLRSQGAAPRVPAEIRNRVLAMSTDVQCEELAKCDPAVAAKIDMKNPRRVARALEVFLATGKSITEFGEPGESPYEVFLIGWNPGREQILARIRSRILVSWDAMVAEVAAARNLYAADAPGIQTIGVPEICDFLDGKMSAASAQELLITHTAQYAKRQITSFKRNKNIVWYTDVNEVCQSLHDFLHKDLQMS